MKAGDLVTFNHVPTPNTPGAPSWSSTPGVGVIISTKSFAPSGLAFNYNLWAEVMWPCKEITRCFKKDLDVVDL